MKLLILLSRIPYPLEKGDKLRAYHQLRYLSQFCEVHLCCLNDAGAVPGAEEALKPFCKSITIIPLKRRNVLWNLSKALFAGLPMQVGYFYNCAAHTKISSLIKEIAPDHIYCQLLRVAKYVKGVDIPKTIDYQDVFSKGYERQAHNRSWFSKPVFYREARLLKKYEAKIFPWFDHHCIISEPDRQELSFSGKDRVEIIHNGVDMEYFVPVEHMKDVDILFTGNMNYPPNVMGAEYLVKKILPLVRESLPGVKVMIAGANPSQRVLSLASENITVTGWMDDIRPAFARSRIFVAPMMIGTGLQNKLLEAMSMKVPCITSPLANDALKAKAGIDIGVCDSPEEYAASVIDLLGHTEKSLQQAEQAYEFVKRHYSWEAETRKLFQLMQAAR